jgi:disulfide bond formation protein DsbB
MTAGASVLRRWPLIAALASAAMLATAHAFERFGGYAPCTLCYRQREVYWVALAAALVGAMVVRFWRPSLARGVCALLALIFLYGAGLAAYHAGVEWKWWPGPTTCTGGGAVSAADMADLLAGHRIRGPSCDKAAWVFLGLSMAGWNALVSLGLSLVSLAAAFRKRIDG